MTKKKILIVDDDPEIFLTLRKRLEFHGFSCSSANSVENAFEKIRGERPDVVLLDLGFPGVDRTAFLRNASQHLPPEESVPPILVLSCFDDQEIVDHVMESGAAGYFSKPYDFRSLVSAIQQCANG